MYQSIIPPAAPGQHEPTRPPMVYIERRLKWEYKQISRDLEKDKPLNEAELHALGEHGWELAAIAQQPPIAVYYFKRPHED